MPKNAEPISYTITDIMRTRLRDLEKEHKLTHDLVAKHIGLDTTYRYKNIFNAGGTQKKVSSDIIEKLARYFECTPDYIIGTSNFKELYKDGNKRKPTQKIYVEFDTKFNLVASHFRKTENYQLLDNLYFLFHDIPFEESQVIFQGINALISPLKKYSSLMNTKPETLNALQDALTFYDDSKIKLLEKYDEANKAFEGHRYKKALCLYLEIFIKCEPITHNICKKVVRSIYSLRNNWSSFPKEIDTLFPSFEEYISVPFNKLEPTTLEIIQNYLNANAKVK